MTSAAIRIRIPYHDVYAIGPGKADLLEAIIATGSISAAAKSMGMSYKRAWDLVNTMNTSFKQPVVATTTGGSHGGGAELTPFGHDVLRHYQKIHQKAYEAVRDELDHLVSLLK